MSQSRIVMGPAAKVQFNGVTFDVTDSDVRIEFKDHDSNDSADATYDNSKVGRKRLVASIKAHVMDDIPWTLGAGVLSALVIYPWGLSFPAYRYASQNFQVTSFSSTHPAKAGDPSTIALEGHSTGTFLEP